MSFHVTKDELRVLPFSVFKIFVHPSNGFFVMFAPRGFCLGRWRFGGAPAQVLPGPVRQSGHPKSHAARCHSTGRASDPISEEWRFIFRCLVVTL